MYDKPVRVPGPVGDRLADELGPVVASEDRGRAVQLDEVVEMVGETVGGDGAFHEAAEADPGVLVHDRRDLDRTPGLVDVELEVDGPHHVRGARLGGVRGRGADALTATSLGHA